MRHERKLAMLGHYLMFNRNCEDALKTYEKAFGTTIREMQKYSDMPFNPTFPIADQDKNLVLNARISIEEAELMCADNSEVSTSGDNMYVSIMTKNEAAVKKAWDILSQGGEVYMELTPSFFAKLHGSLKDRFGINWMFTALK